MLDLSLPMLIRFSSNCCCNHPLKSISPRTRALSDSLRLELWMLNFYALTWSKVKSIFFGLAMTTSNC
jgi:hypothetical protein